jgi:DNA-directed RNA polymerase specialized sigma subunit
VIIEEYRDLSLEEWNFRKILQEHLENLLEKQRGIIKWACLGDENTKKIMQMPLSGTTKIQL